MENNRLIFIGGVPRSGTTLLQKMLDMHSDIYAGPEFDHIPMICQLFNKMKHGNENGRQTQYYSVEEIKKAIRVFIESILIGKADKEEVQFLSEKTPSNLLVFNDLAQLCENAKFIIVVRDPRGCIASFKNVQKRAAKFGDEIKIGKNLYSDLHLINKYIGIGEKFYQENMNKCYQIKYEKLIDNPTLELKQICDFLEIKFEDQMLDINKYKNDSSDLINQNNITVRSWFEPGMLDKKIRKGNDEKWTKELTKIEKAIVSNYFLAKSYKCYSEYKFDSLSNIEKISLMPQYLSEFGFRRTFKRFVEGVN